MALTRAAAPVVAPADPADIPEVPVTIPRDRWDRPLIVPAGGGKPVSYTRASTLGKTLEDTYNLNQWAIRQTTFGLSRRPDLVTAAAAVSSNEGDDRETLQSISAQAQEAARSTAAATMGTALHLLSEQRDAGRDLSHLAAEPRAALDAYSRIMARLTVRATETFIVHDGWETAGTFDRVVSPDGTMTAPDGTVFGPEDRLVLDLKTGKDARWFGPTYAVQQAVYGHGEPYSVAGGRVGWPGGVAPSEAWALILHVPIASPVDSALWWVDIGAGAEFAELALTVRAARKRRGLFLPADAPTGQVPAAVTQQAVIGMLRAASTRAEVDRLYDSHVSIWSEFLTAVARARLGELDGARV